MTYLIRKIKFKYVLEEASFLAIRDFTMMAL